MGATAFLLSPSREKPKQNSTFLFSQHGAEYNPYYAVRHLDPEQHASRNRYAVGIYDAHVPDVLFAEVLLIPEWTQPTLSAEQIRLNGGVVPPPEPILPTEFAIQLYNPDQQIVVKYRPATFTKDAAWEFEMPQQTFREPSSSALDRSQHDPVALDLTPKVRLKWKKDSKFNKDLTCYQSGRSLNPDGTRQRNKEPNITMAILKNFKEVTLYEPNFNRIEIEDMKGFEVVLLVGAVVIRDVYFSPMKETFNLGADGRKASTTSPQLSSTSPVPVITSGLIQSPPQHQPALPVRHPRIPPTDPRTQWEIDTETARLQRQAAEEEKERQRRDAAEQRRIKKMLEAEEKETRRRQAEVDKETERLRKLYGQEDASARPTLAIQTPQHHSDPRFQSAYTANQGPPNQSHSGPYMSGAAAQSNLLTPAAPEQQKLKQKHSIFSFRRHSDQDSNKLSKKRSAVF